MAETKTKVASTSETKIKATVKKTTTKTKTETKETTSKKASTKKATTKTTTKVEKAAKLATREAVKEETKKPTVTEAKAKAISLKITPRKCRLSCDLVRGKNCVEALEILFNTHHKSAELVSKLVKSAMANAVNNFNMNEDKLYIASIMASDSIKMKRYLPRAKGSASGLIKRYTNLYVVVKERI